MADMRPIGIQSERQLDAACETAVSLNGSAGRDRDCVQTPKY